MALTGFPYQIKVVLNSGSWSETNLGNGLKASDTIILTRVGLTNFMLNNWRWYCGHI